MLKILLCCGGGFSSSYLVTNMQKQIKEKQLPVEIDYSPFSLINEKKDAYDIVVCCPHLEIYVKQYLKTNSISIPIYLLPPKLYGLMNVESIYEDALDIIEIYKQSLTNPVRFEGEEKNLRIKRNCSYRQYQLKKGRC